MVLFYYKSLFQEQPSGEWRKIGGGNSAPAVDGIVVDQCGSRFRFSG